ncbi:MAG: formate/nitrite transporter family protein [Clostridia bacterium]|jgi:formate/nitrite transporter FocA (FNT family)|nr:formate/nitrite transporter family protein [Clostridia bacterium]
MKEFVKMTKKELIAFVLASVMSGLMIGIGGTAALMAKAKLGDFGGLIGACLFSLGIFAIVTFELRLFTGMVADIPTMGFKNTWKLPVCFFGNIFGVGVIALLVYFTSLRADLVAQATAISTAKFAGNWPIQALCSSILCGALITLSVWSVKYSPRKGLDATLGVTLPIIVFAFCGFDHSVANVLYFYLSGTFGWEPTLYELICVIGNILGGIILPLVHLYRDKAKKRD